MSKNDLEIITLAVPGITDFAKERNHLLKKSRSDWVLFLDSDEKVTPKLMTEVNSTLNKVRNLDAYYLKRKIYFLGKYIGEDKVLRLAKRSSGKWVRAVHETWQVKTRFGTLQNYIIHNTADNLHEYIEKMNKYSTLHAQENFREGKQSSPFKIVVYPFLKFLQNIFFGRGFVFSMLQSFHSFLAWSKAWQSTRNTGQAKS